MKLIQSKPSNFGTVDC